jgi:hypothetical protein
MGIVLPSAQAGKSSTNDSLSPSSTSSQPTSTSTSTLPSSSYSTTPPPSKPPSTAPPALSSSSSQRQSVSPPLARVPSPTSSQPQLSPTQTLSDTTVRTSPPSTSQFSVTQDTLRNAGTTLRRPLAEYESAIDALSASLNQSIQMWKEVREASPSDPTANHLAQQFQSLFSSLTGQIARVDPSLTASFTQSTTSGTPALETSPAQSNALERYSGHSLPPHLSPLSLLLLLSPSSPSPSLLFPLFISFPFFLFSTSFPLFYIFSSSFPHLFLFFSSSFYFNLFHIFFFIFSSSFLHLFFIFSSSFLHLHLG